MPIVRGALYGTASFAAMHGRYELQPRVRITHTVPRVPKLEMLCLKIVQKTGCVF